MCGHKVKHKKQINLEIAALKSKYLNERISAAIRDINIKAK